MRAAGVAHLIILSAVFLMACEREGSSAPNAKSETTGAEYGTSAEAGGSQRSTESRGGELPPTARITEGRGPSLYLGPDAGSPAFGYLTAGVVVELAGELEGSRVLARVRGGMRVRGYVPVHRLEFLSLTRGRVRDTPVYLGGGDPVKLLGYADEPGRVRVAVSPAIVSREGARVNVPRYEGSFPVAALGGEAPDHPPALPGRPILIRAEHALPVFDETGSERLLTLPPNHHFEAYEVRRDEGRIAILLGSGPYLAGYLHHGEIIADPSPRTPPHATKERAPANAARGELPERIRRDESSGPLRRVKPATRVAFDGVTIASIDAPAYAREMARYVETGEVDVFVAVDDQVAIRGMIPADAIESVD